MPLRSQKLAAKSSLILGLVLAASFLAQATDGAPLRVVAKKGDAHKYRAVARYEIEGKTLIQTQTTLYEVQSVGSDGIITAHETYTVVAAQYGGQPLPSGTTTSVVTAMRPDGTYASISDSANAAEDMRLENLNVVKLPDFALEKGKKWSWDCAADAKTGAVKLHAVYKVVGPEKIDGAETWKIEFHSKEADGDPPASCEGNVWLDRLSGLTVKLDAKGENLPFAGAPGPVSGSQTLDLVAGT